MAGLYVHVPFCHAKCWYCDFYSMPAHQHIEAWMKALLNEWNVRRHELKEPVATLYIGGGTPSNLPHNMLGELITTLQQPSMTEITVEVNPEDVTDQLATTLKKNGVNRVSMGVQSLADAELQAVGRRHSAQKAIEAVELLRKSGINNLSLDLIYGLPYQTIESWQQSVKGILELHPEHISAYSLSYEDGTRLTAQLKNGKITETPQEVSAEMYEILCRLLKEAGYEHYEISNFALPSKRSQHNSAYWTFAPYLGLGPSAHSFTNRRKYNPASLKEYVAANGIIAKCEEENENEKLNDYIMVRLRTSDGINLQQVKQLFGTKAALHITNTAAPHLASGTMELTPEGNLRITEKAWIVSDGIMCDFMMV